MTGLSLFTGMSGMDMEFEAAGGQIEESPGKYRKLLRNRRKKCEIN
jgi:hypothetical protein